MAAPLATPRQGDIERLSTGSRTYPIAATGTMLAGMWASPITTATSLASLYGLGELMMRAIGGKLPSDSNAR